MGYYVFMQRKPFQPVWKLLPESLRTEILTYAKEHSAKAACEKYFSQSGFSTEDTFYSKLLSEMRKLKAIDGVSDLPVVTEEGLLTSDELQLLNDFKEGKVGYDRMQKELAYRAFKKILVNPEGLQIRDWLQSELVKLKQDETTKQKDALERFINALFGGFIPAMVCPHCHKSTIIKVDTLGENLDVESGLPKN